MDTFVLLSTDMDWIKILQRIWDFNKYRPTFLDIFIIALGIFVLGYQIYVRLTNTWGRFCKGVQRDRFLITRTEIKLQYIANLIELLPILGILGTVWGLGQALDVLSVKPNAGISDISQAIAPALSTTLFGLIFAGANLFLYNFLQGYLSEVIEWCRQGFSEKPSPGDTPVQAKEKKAPEKPGN